MLKVLFVFLGGGIGSSLRYGISQMLNERIVATAFPWPTFTVNIVGSFLIGLFYALSTKLNLSAEVRLLLTTGLCGGFTTFSTFSNESLMLLKQGFYGMFALYVGLSIAFGLAAVLLGSIIIK